MLQRFCVPFLNHAGNLCFYPRGAVSNLATAWLMLAIHPKRAFYCVLTSNTLCRCLFLSSAYDHLGSHISASVVSALCVIHNPIQPPPLLLECAFKLNPAMLANALRYTFYPFIRPSYCSPTSTLALPSIELIRNVSREHADTSKIVPVSLFLSLSCNRTRTNFCGNFTKKAHIPFDVILRNPSNPFKIYSFCG